MPNMSTLEFEIETLKLINQVVDGLIRNSADLTTGIFLIEEASPDLFNKISPSILAANYSVQCMKMDIRKISRDYKQEGE